MTHELFTFDCKETLTREETAQARALRSKISTAKGLGLDAQVAALQADLATVERGSLITTAPMSNDEILIWNAWLPTIYRDDASNSRLHMSNYQFDRIPQPVLRRWKMYKEAGLFERFEIWTPERNDPNPILIGVNGHCKHLLARWGESDANLVTLDDIKQELVRRWHKNHEIHGSGDAYSRENRLMNSALVGMVGGALMFLFCYLYAKYFMHTESALGATGIALSTLTAVGVYLGTYRRQTASLFKRSDVMQAIARHDATSRTTLSAA